MRKVSNVIVGLAAAAVCALMAWITLGAGREAVIYNLSFLAVMLLIIALALVFGFARMSQTVHGLNRASVKLMNVYQNRDQIGDLTRAGAQIFGVGYLDRKYQEYLGYLRKTNSPCDIGDYIGEYEINNYTHRRLVEMVPDVLTSLGILGTFMGLVWGLRGFNPVSYEAMASSITSLIDGIKVAFVTSIFGITLSLAYSYWLRGALTNVSESLDNFTDKYYLCAVSPTDATAMNHVLSNQREQTRAIENMGVTISDQLAVSMADHMDPVMTQMNQTLDHFVKTVTLNQEELLETIAASVMAAMKKEFISEFLEMRSMLKESNKVQKEYLDYITKAQAQFEQNLNDGAKQMSKAVEDSNENAKASMEELKIQQEQLSEFVEYMTKAMGNMSAMNAENAKVLEAVTAQIGAMEKLSNESAQSAANATRAMAEAVEASKAAQAPPVYHEISDLDELTERMDQIISLLERSAKAQAKSSSRRGLLFR